MPENAPVPVESPTGDEPGSELTTLSPRVYLRTPWGWLLFLRLLFFLSCVSPVVTALLQGERLFGVTPMPGWLWRWLTPRQTRSHRPDREQAVRSFVTHLLGRYLPPFDNTCVPQCLAYYYFCTRYGVPLTFHAGVRRGDDGLLEGHTWLTRTGVPYAGGDGAGYRETFQYPETAVDLSTAAAGKPPLLTILQAWAASGDERDAVLRRYLHAGLGQTDYEHLSTGFCAGLAYSLVSPLVRDTGITPLAWPSFRTYAHTVAARNHIILDDMPAVQRLLEDADIPSVVLKGAGLYAWGAYERETDRVLTDIDVLVREEQALAARACLLDAGYAESPLLTEGGAAHMDTHHLAGVVSPRGTIVEIHFELGEDELGHGRRLDCANQWRTRRQAPAMTSVWTSSPEDLLKHILFHSVGQHTDFLYILAARSMADMIGLVRVAGDAFDWDYFVRSTRDEGCARDVFLLPVVLNDLIDIPALRDVCMQEHLAADVAAHLRRDMVRRFQEGREMPMLWPGAWYLLETDSWLKRLRVVGEMIVPGPAAMRARYPRLTEWGWSGLALAYLLRPLRMVVGVRRVPGHWRALKTAWGDRAERRR